MSGGASIAHVDRLELAYAPKPWQFAIKRRVEIDAYFTELKRAKPALWNGRVLLMHEYALAAGVFRGSFLETDFASFRAWHAWDCPGEEIFDCFAAAAICGADGAFLLAEMGAHTANAGRVYFPCGTPDSSDIANGRVDFEFSVRRELSEETGLSIDGFDTEPGWTVVFDGPLIAHIKVLRSSDNASAVRTRILNHLASEQQPELSGIRIVRGPADFDQMMPGFVTAFLADRLG